MNPNLVENWAVLDQDNALTKAIQKQNKWSHRQDSKVLDYQKNQLVQALKYVKQFTTAIDAGANYGIMSYHLSDFFDKVYAFEIDNAVRNCLSQNMQKFNCTNVEILSCGLGDKESNASLKYIKNSFATHVDPDINDGKYLVKTIDSFNFSSCGFIKIDCEGYEPHIIKGGEQTIKRFQPVILMEDKGLSANYGLKENEAEILLTAWGYKRVISFKKDCIMAYGRKT